MATEFAGIIMAIKKEHHDFCDIISSLSEDDKILVNNLHEYVLSFGFIYKISAIGKKQNNWKCEYTKHKKVLFILRIINTEWSIRCKLFNMAKYQEIFESCQKDFIDKLIKNSKDCERHGGRCNGPIAFSIAGKKYSKCRHCFMLKELKNGDIDEIKKLLECENEYIKKEIKLKQKNGV
jgi:hypothetical protein